MQTRDAVASAPDVSFARLVAVATGLTTLVVLGGAVAAILGGSRPPAPVEVEEDAAIARFRAAAPVTVRGPTPEELATARAELAAYAYATFPKWVTANPDRECPRNLLELNAFDPTLHAVDPWGTPYQFICGTPYGPLSTRSAGPDRRYETADDLSSKAR